MNVWCHLPTIINRRYALRIAGLVALCVALITTLIFGHVSYAAPGINKTLSFQGRLLRSNGGVVADGHYNIQFKIYQNGAGTAANNPGGTLKWTETYVNGGGNNAVEVKNGYFSVNLGSLNAFGNSVDWNQDTLWLSMNVAGSSTSCTTFGTAPCAADGEMLPMKRITSVPYALQAENANTLGNLGANNFVQLGQGVQEDASSNTSSIFINKTGSGNLLQLQNTATDILTVDNSGNLTFGSNGDKTISIANASDNTNGGILTVAAGNGGNGGGSNGGDLVLQGGHAGGDNADGGVVVIDSGNGSGGGHGGTIYMGTANDAGIQIGNTNLGGGTQTIVIGTNGNSGGTTNVVIGSEGGSGGGTTKIQAKNSVTIDTDGTTRATFSDSTNTVYFGNGVSSSTPNDFTLQGTDSTTSSVAGGSLTVQGGNATTGDANGGNVTISGGTGSGTGANGLVVLTTPTFSTVTNDANCYTSGSLVSSSCTITNSTVNNASAAIIGFDTTDQAATLPDPTITTPGRILYLMAAGNSEDFTVSMNDDNNQLTMQQNTAATLLWNGSDWVVAGASSSVVQGGNNFRMMQSFSGSDLTVNEGAEEPTPDQPQEPAAETPVAPTTEQTPDNENDLFKLSKNASAPTASADELLGSMYYDTTLGKVQCYEADGWGACGASPDTFVTISPEYTNAVMNGTDIGTITSDLCSDTLNINDGSNSQPSICGINETYNFYKWTSGESTNQTRSIFLTYQLPSTFKKFVAGSTSLLGRTNSDNANVSYQVYRDNNSTGLTSCGTPVSVATGSQSTWQKAVANDSSDPSNCEFEAGDSILIRINLTAKSNANAYISNVGFTFSNN